jgi:Family of unknown function (DUF5670)
MLRTIAIISIVLWALGLLTSYTMSVLLPLLVVFALARLLIRTLRDHERHGEGF